MVKTDSATKKKLIKNKIPPSPTFDYVGSQSQSIQLHNTLLQEPLLTLKVKKLKPNAVLPTRANKNDAGIDLTTIKKVLIPSNSTKAIETGLAFELPNGWYGQMQERSGFSLYNTLKLKAGVIDSGYRGEIKIVFQNCGDYPVQVEAGTKVAQIILLPVTSFTITEVKELSASDRGKKGFGSSDKLLNTHIKAEF